MTDADSYSGCDRGATVEHVKFTSEAQQKSFRHRCEELERINAQLSGKISVLIERIVRLENRIEELLNNKRG